jgi:hypothetical protein
MCPLRFYAIVAGAPRCVFAVMFTLSPAIVSQVRHQDYHPVPWVEKRSRFVYHYSTAESVLDSYRKRHVPFCSILRNICETADVVTRLISVRHGCTFISHPIYR